MKKKSRATDDKDKFPLGAPTRQRISEESTLSVMKFEFGTDGLRMHTEGNKVVISGKNGRVYNILGQILKENKYF